MLQKPAGITHYSFILMKYIIDILAHNLHSVAILSGFNIYYYYLFYLKIVLNRFEMHEQHKKVRLRSRK